jgi:hypothetical protein
VLEAALEVLGSPGDHSEVDHGERHHVSVADLLRAALDLGELRPGPVELALVRRAVRGGVHREEHLLLVARLLCELQPLGDERVGALIVPVDPHAGGRRA